MTNMFQCDTIRENCFTKEKVHTEEKAYMKEKAHERKMYTKGKA